MKYSVAKIYNNYTLEIIAFNKIFNILLIIIIKLSHITYNL